MLYFKTILTIKETEGEELVKFNIEDKNNILKNMVPKAIEEYLNNKNVMSLCYDITSTELLFITRINIDKMLFTFDESMIIDSIAGIYDLGEHKAEARLKEIPRGVFSHYTELNDYNPSYLTRSDKDVLKLSVGGRGNECVDYVVINDLDANEIKSSIINTPYYEDLNKELLRINKSESKFSGHPVHYMIRATSSSDNTIAYALADQLYKNKRILSRRLAITDLNDIDSKEDLISIYRNNVGCAVLLKINNASDSSDIVSVNSNSQRYIDMMDLCYKYRHKVLTILVLNPNDVNTKNTVINNISEAITFVEINNKLLLNKKAKAYLVKMFKANNVMKCPIVIEKDKAYNYNDLETMFNTWMDDNLKNNVHPVYSKQLSKITKKEVKGKANETLNEMIGLKDVKVLLKEVLSYFKLQELYQKRGISTGVPCRHMVFSGNPGTAKTTVARLFGQILKDNGLLPDGRVIEIGRSDLIEKYVGWTAKNVKAKIADARGGILFIDEAYSLVDDRSGSFGDEAINTLVQEMDNVREHTIIILAGYPDKMEQFMSTNPGLRSRIGFNVNFPNYTPDELIDVMKLMANNKKLTFTDEALVSVKDLVVKNINNKDFGNGRFIRSVLEKTTMKQSVRILGEDDYESMTDEELLTINSEDIIDNMETTKTKTMGFNRY